MRPLFVSGCERSGTTAFANYLNQHPRIMVLRERYRYHPEKVTPDLFDFDRILDFTEADRDERRKIDAWYKNITARLLSGKDPAELEWIGDKDPFYLEDLEDLNRNNPGARFIVLYRPVEEVAESWQARSSNPEDVWPERKDFEVGVETWNRALNLTRRFIEGDSNPEVLLIDYHDFFYRNEACADLISAFLELEFDESLRVSWEAMSQDFEAARRPKKPLTARQISFIRERKDSEAERWILDRISRQWSELGIRTGDTAEPTEHDERRRVAELMAARGETRAQALRADELEEQLVKQKEMLASQREINRRLRRRNRRLALQIQQAQAPKLQKALELLGRIRKRLFAR